VKSRYNGLRTIGTLSLIIAWITLILGVLFGIATWLGLNSVQNALSGFDINVNLGPLPIFGILPGLLWGILGFLLYYAIGKTLHLLVDVDERTMQMRPSVEQPVAVDETGSEVSGEMKRQAKLIAANLEATQDIQRQLAAIDSRMSGGLASAPAAAVAAVAAVASETADDVAATADSVAASANDAASDIAAAV